MFICDLYFQDPEIGSLMIFVIIVIIVIVISQHSEPVYWSCSEDIVRHWLSYCNFCEVTGIPSIEWLMNCSYFCTTNHMFAVMCEFVVSVTT